MKPYSRHALRASSFLLPLLASGPAHATPEACNGNQGEVYAVELDTNSVTRQGEVLTVWTETSKNPDRACNTRTFVLVDPDGALDPITLDAARVGTVAVQGGTFTRSWGVSLPADLPVGGWELQYAEEGFPAELAAAPLFVTFDAGLGAPTDPALLGDATISWRLGTKTASFQLDTSSPELDVIVDDLDDDITAEERSSPDAFVGALTAELFGQERVLWGRWDGNYVDGQAASSRWNPEGDSTAPWDWTSSTALLASGGDRVKYGQCMVFSAVTASIMRKVGIPTRVMTNLDSARESKSGALGYRGDFRPNRPGDLHQAAGTQRDKPAGSIWNFHVWTEYWSKDTGWNAFDGTCQEMSDGPERLSAILAGESTGFTTAPESFPAELGSPAGTPAGKVFTTVGAVPFGG